MRGLSPACALNSTFQLSRAGSRSRNTGYVEDAVGDAISVIVNDAPATDVGVA
jgi:hypothetical protein